VIDTAAGVGAAAQATTHTLADKSNGKPKRL